MLCVFQTQTVSKEGQLLCIQQLWGTFSDHSFCIFPQYFLHSLLLNMFSSSLYLLIYLSLKTELYQEPPDISFNCIYQWN